MIEAAEIGIDVPRSNAENVKTKCPQCQHTRKHRNDRPLSFNQVTGVYNCHHCGWKGKVVSPTSNVVPMSNRRSYEKPMDLPENVDVAHQQLVAYANTRGISETTLGEFAVRTTREYCGGCEGEVNVALFPYVLDGEHINTKHRCGSKHFRLDPGAQLALYNLDACRDADIIFIVEGEWDALACHEAGRPHVVSVPNGASTGSQNLDYITSGQEVFDGASRIVIATDSDAPGQALLNELGRRIGFERCVRVTWPEGIKDANDMLVQHGVAALRDILDNPFPFPVEGIYTGEDMVTDLRIIWQVGYDRGATTEVFPTLDEYYRPALGYMSIWTGHAGHGKSTVLDNWLYHACLRNEWKCAIFSPEQQPLPRHQQSLIEIHEGKPMLNNYDDRMTEQEMLAANDRLSRYFSYINPEEDVTLDNLLALAKIEVFRRGIRALVLDPWNEIEHLRGEEDGGEYISRALSKIRRFTRTHNIHTFLVAHPTKMSSTPGEPEPVPLLTNISGSINFRNKADYGISVHRDAGALANQVDVHVTKIRMKETGQLGAVTFNYDHRTNRIQEVGKKL